MVQELSQRGGSLVAISEVAARARHGRRESRQLWVMHDPEFNQYAGSSGEWGQPWPSLAQVCRMERRRSPWRRGQAVGEAQVEVSYYITSAPPRRADAGRLLRVVRGHWGIENRCIGCGIWTGMKTAAR